MKNSIKDRIYLSNEISLLIEQNKGFETKSIFTIKDDLSIFHWSLNYDFEESSTIELIYYENCDHLIYLENFKPLDNKLKSKICSFANLNMITILEPNQA